MIANRCLYFDEFIDRHLSWCLLIALEVQCSQIVTSQFATKMRCHYHCLTVYFWSILFLFCFVYLSFSNRCHLLCFECFIFNHFFKVVIILIRLVHFNKIRLPSWRKKEWSAKNWDDRICKQSQTRRNQWTLSRTGQAIDLAVSIRS